MVKSAVRVRANGEGEAQACTSVAACYPASFPHSSDILMVENAQESASSSTKQALPSSKKHAAPSPEKQAAQLRRGRRYRFFRKAYDTLTMPLAIVYLTHSHGVHRKYNMPWPRRMRMGFRFWRNYLRMRSGTSWRAHLVMAMRLLETSPLVRGDVVECGCWKGGATVNLSLVCAIVNRKLRVYDSFEGLPPPVKGDHVAMRGLANGLKSRGFFSAGSAQAGAKPAKKDRLKGGRYIGSLEEVTDNVRRLGAIDACTFHKGWFKDTLPHHEGDLVFAFWDVDYYASLHDCLIHLWPHLVDGAHVFMDEYRDMPYCSVFFSEKYWRKYFDCDPPGIAGIGTGLQMGMFYNNPSVGMGYPALQYAESTAYSRKGDRCIWDFYPDENGDSQQAGEATAAP